MMLIILCVAVLFTSKVRGYLPAKLDLQQEMKRHSFFSVSGLQIGLANPEYPAGDAIMRLYKRKNNQRILPQ
ncbi:hypothetical protein ACFGVS_15135 [Mucilaginibacter sp. AW1-7]|uniref:hypothetical protein n=1 Tax=Mucilaginibacter sp. AW1-7 TaxID=3349874 RepID=UPI003F736073